MKIMKNKWYVTTPIYYVNDKPHIGHAYTSLAADIVARYYRLKGYDVFFLTGTDEHGQKLENVAKALNKNPKEFADEAVVHFKNMNRELDITIDHFIRTTDESHINFVQNMYLKIKNNGDIYKGFYEGPYCVGCEKFIRDIELVDGKCPLHKKEPIEIKEESYFFRLSKYTDKLLRFYEENPEFISPSYRKKEIINRVKEGLKDLSISRQTIKWGIPVPDDPLHVIYVWLDALLNYISALEFGSEKYKKYWPADVHFVGKDILWFHTVIWPALLMSAKLPLPKMVFAHGFWTVDGNKMSKTLGNVIDPIEMKNKYGLDEFKYYLFNKSRFGHDNDFSEENMINVINTELADEFGNLVNRIIVLTNLSFNGKIIIPEKITEYESMFKELMKNYNEILKAYEKYEFHKVFDILRQILKEMNKIITDTESWTFKKQGKIEELKSFIFGLLECLRYISILLLPVMPNKAEKILKALGFSKENQNIQDFSTLGWRNKNGLYKSKQITVKKLILFKKIKNKK
ncbi:MAG: methionine--tRNA ligase [Candidatus Helarchaeota archaeon]